jgi:nucleoside-diphosphate-sugar epimerase
MKKILLTGGLGYIGSYFFEKYCSKYDLTIIDTNYFQAVDENKNIVYKDIRNIKLSSPPQVFMDFLKRFSQKKIKFHH